MSSTDSLAQQLRQIADTCPMSAGTRTRLFDLANKVEVVERDRKALIETFKVKETS